MLRRHLQTTRGVVLNNSFEVRRVVEEVVAYATADKCLFHTLHLAYLAVEVNKGRVVVVHIGAELGV